jgi:glutamate-1-semialdehyde 2,1-aminomutase
LHREAGDSQPKSLAYGQSLRDSVSDVGFTSRYRVPFPFRSHIGPELTLGSVVTETRDVRIKDIDGNWRYDLSGSYGVNVFGYDFYKECMAEAQSQVGDLGPVLGPYHPVIRDNVEILKQISGLDEVSFHMSGTEAVMQAVRLARYHTGRSHLVRLCGAYHGWWDGVQPGVGNQRRADDVYTLEDLSKQTLRVLSSRRDIACVLINPLQALHPNADAPGDGTLLTSARSAQCDKDRYTAWLKELRDVCTAHGIVLIFDEVFTGFRLAYRGAQEFFGVQADMVTYGKTIGGGYPVGVLCGRRALMKRYRESQPANISFARGTFNSHPYVMAAMSAFLQRVAQPEYQQLYQKAQSLWAQRMMQLNERMHNADVPVRIAALQTVWTVLYTRPSRYNWMLQFYLRSEGLELSWVGSGRMIFSFNFTDTQFDEVCDRFVRAASRMNADGWWWQSATLTHQSIRRQIALELLQARFAWQTNTQPPAVNPPTGDLEEVK